MVLAVYDLGTGLEEPLQHHQLGSFLVHIHATDAVTLVLELQDDL